MTATEKEQIQKVLDEYAKTYGLIDAQGWRSPSCVNLATLAFAAGITQGKKEQIDEMNNEIAKIHARASIGLTKGQSILDERWLIGAMFMVKFAREQLKSQLSEVEK